MLQASWQKTNQSYGHREYFVVRFWIKKRFVTQADVT